MNEFISFLLSNYYHPITLDEFVTMFQESIHLDPEREYEFLCEMGENLFDFLEPDSIFENDVASAYIDSYIHARVSQYYLTYLKLHWDSCKHLLPKDDDQSPPAYHWFVHLHQI